MSCGENCNTCKSCDGKEETDEQYDDDGELIVKFPSKCGACATSICTCRQKVSAYVR